MTLTLSDYCIARGSSFVSHCNCIMSDSSDARSVIIRTMHTPVADVKVR